MKNLLLLAFISILVSGTTSNDFITGQKKYERVKTAYKEKGSVVSEVLKEENLLAEELNILIIAYKEEKKLDLYAKNKNDNHYKKILTYDICAFSGELGPKRQQGDGQVPEGFYFIDRFNPTSNFYLSLRLNYPNLSDKIKSKASNKGGDIYIHGECVTIGCMPMTNEKIKEIYLYAIQAKQNGQEKIPVYVFPFIMTKEKIANHEKSFGNVAGLISFWGNLKTGYDKFSEEKKELKYTVEKNGDYKF